MCFYLAQKLFQKYGKQMITLRGSNEQVYIRLIHMYIVISMLLHHIFTHNFLQDIANDSYAPHVRERPNILE